MNKTHYIFLILFVFCFDIKSQTNLTYNGDFEIYSSCPINLSDPTQAPNYEITKCINWTSATYGTSDYFNICSTGSLVGVPTNTFGFQHAYNSNGYAGCYFASYNGGSGTDGYNGIMWWEYILGQFTQPLTANKKYSLSLYISLAEHSDLCIKEFGAYMSQTPVTSPNTAALTVTPQVKFYNSSYFTDTINWNKVIGEYIANGGEQYITIGNFNNNITTDTIRRYWAASPPLISYYYIDNIEITDLREEQPIPNVFTPNDDGVNDLWKLPSGLKDYEVIIYNRWGNQILKASADGFMWDGKLKNGNMCYAGSYFYIIQNKNDLSTNFKGFLQLYQ